MTKVIRFMSTAEAIKLVAGVELVNTANHGDKKAKTDSVGFCFTDGKVGVHGAAKYLTGITSPDAVFVGNLKKSSKLKKGYGVYAKPVDIPYDPAEIISMLGEMLKEMGDGTFFNPDESKLQTVNEWSGTTYSLEDFSSWGIYVAEPYKPQEGDSKLVIELMGKGSERWKTKLLVAGKDIDK